MRLMLFFMLMAPAMIVDCRTAVGFFLPWSSVFRFCQERRQVYLPFHHQRAAIFRWAMRWASVVLGPVVPISDTTIPSLVSRCSIVPGKGRRGRFRRCAPRRSAFGNEFRLCRKTLVQL
jgi:hypothetical protein